MPQGMGLYCHFMDDGFGSYNFIWSVYKDVKKIIRTTTLFFVLNERNMSREMFAIRTFIIIINV